MSDAILNDSHVIIHLVTITANKVKKKKKSTSLTIFSALGEVLFPPIRLSSVLMPITTVLSYLSEKVRLHEEIRYLTALEYGLPDDWGFS